MRCLDLLRLRFRDHVHRRYIHAPDKQERVDLFFKDAEGGVNDHFCGRCRERQFPVSVRMLRRHLAVMVETNFTLVISPFQYRELYTTAFTKIEKEKAVGNTRYTSKYPFSGILICGTCGSRLRRHVRKTGSGKLVPSWGCSNRILNGREVCDSYHVNEDVLYATYHAAVQAMVEDAGSILSTLESATEKELQPSNKAALDEVEQKIIDLQEKVLALHRQKRAQAVNDAYYNAQVNDYSQQLAALEDRQQALQTADARYATVRMWLADFQQHMQEGDATDDRDGKMMKSLVESIIIWPDRMEIHFKCGVNIEQKYVK